MADTKLDILQGATRTQGMQDKRADSAVRPFRVKNLATANTNADEAIAAVIAAAGSTHQSDTTLDPLAVSVSRKTGFDRVRGSIVYGRGPASKPTAEAWKLASQTTGVYNLRYHRDPMHTDANGRPDGTFNYDYSTRGGTASLSSVSTHSVPMGYQRLLLETLLTSDPTAAVKPYLQMSNSSPCTLASMCNPAGTGTTSDMSFGAYEAWFYGFTSRKVHAYAGIRYRVTYEILVMPAPGWVQQVALAIAVGGPPILINRPIIASAYYNGGSPLPEAVVFDYVFTPRIGNLNGVLPVHTSP